MRTLGTWLKSLFFSGESQTSEESQEAFDRRIQDTGMPLVEQQRLEDEDIADSAEG